MQYNAYNKFINNFIYCSFHSLCLFDNLTYQKVSYVQLGYLHTKYLLNLYIHNNVYKLLRSIRCIWPLHTFEVEKTARFVPVASAAVHVTALCTWNERKTVCLCRPRCLFDLKSLLRRAVYKNINMRKMIIID